MLIECCEGVACFVLWDYLLGILCVVMLIECCEGVACFVLWDYLLGMLCVVMSNEYRD